MPVSPYAASKLAAESYDPGLRAVVRPAVLAFRFFNVFGPLQAADHAYAAVVPAFVAAALPASPLPCTATAARPGTSPTSAPWSTCWPTPCARRVTSPEPVNLAFGTRVSLLELITALERSPRPAPPASAQRAAPRRRARLPGRPVPIAVLVPRGRTCRPGAGPLVHGDLVRGVELTRRWETATGFVLVALFVMVAAVVHLHPGENAIDRFGFLHIGAAPRSALFTRITELALPWVLIAGAVLAAALAFPSDRRRALACMLGPLLVAVIVEYAAKPAVGRTLEGVLTFPSGNVADVSAVVTALVLAVPRRARFAVAVLAAAVVVAVSVAVIGLRWHYPSDAAGGAVLGVGAVLLVDGVIHRG